MCAPVDKLAKLWLVFYGYKLIIMSYQWYESFHWKSLLLSAWLYNCTIMYMYNIYEMNQWIFIVLTWTSTVDTGIYCSYLTTSVCKSLFNLNYFNAWNALTFSIIEKYRYRYVLLCIYTKVNISVDLLAMKTFILAFVVKCIYLSNPYFTGLKLSRPFTWV